MKRSPSRRRRSMESEVVFSTAISNPDSFRDHRAHAVGSDAFLLQRITIANRHGSILHRLAVHRDAERSADFILPTIAAANGTRLVVEHRERAAQLLRKLVSELRHAVLLHERENTGFHRR